MNNLSTHDTTFGAAQRPVEILATQDTGDPWGDRLDISACMAERPPRVPAYLGYDEVGSQLFERITELPTYYLTRVEHRLLIRHAAEMADLMECGSIAELGSGSAKKTHLLLAACLDRQPTTYLPIDVSREMLQTSARELVDELPHLVVQGLWGRYEQGLAHLSQRSRGEHGSVVVALLGSTLGNATPLERDALLAEIARTLEPGDGFLVSLDLRKSAAVFDTCYNDPPDRSAFASFRLNHLAHLNRLLDGDFAVERFFPRAQYDPGTAMVNAYVYSTRTQSVSLPRIGLELNLQRGDRLNVGIAYKFDAPQFVADLAARGLDLRGQWTDHEWRYGIFLFSRSG